MADRVYEKEEIIINRYVVQQQLGAGNFSHVYKVLDTLSGEVVALKIFKEGTGVLDQLRQEFRILNELQHPHIARVYDIGQLPNCVYYLKLEYVEGNTLTSLIHENRISLRKAQQIVFELLDAVAYLHGHRVMHRDIKPNNIITNGRGTVIVDFNISKQVESYATSRVGTPLYMPPEVHAEGWNWTGDLYAVGLVLYEMLTGHHPFDDAHPPATADPHDPREFNQLLSESLVRAVLKAISRDRVDRFQTALEMQDALKAADWGPVWQPYRLSLPDLSHIRITPEEASRPNYNPYLTCLLTLYSQSRRTNAGTRGLDAFARVTYVPTRLDTALKPAVLNGDHPLVIITGNAGDGKTAFIQKMEEEIENAPDTTHFEKLPSGNGSRFVHKGFQFLTNYDGSQDEGGVNNDQVLSQFLRPFGGPGPIQAIDRVHVIAINEGRLVDFLQSHRNDFPYLYHQVRDFFEREQVPDPEMLIVNLNLRAVVADGDDDSSIFDQMVDRLASPTLWERCQGCDIADCCYAKFNADSLNDPNYGPQIRHRLKALFQTAHFRQRLHITIRDLRSALAYILFGTDNCDGIHALLADLDRRHEYLARFYYNAPFDFEQPELASQDRLVCLLALVDPGRVSNPKLDARLAFTPPDELSLLPPFNTRGDYDLQLLCNQYDDSQSVHRISGSGLPAEDQVRLSRLYHACLRRKVYFERVDEEWPQMLPYARFAKFLDLMQSRESAKLDQVRNVLVRAISLSEGIYNAEVGQDYLCLRSSQEPRVTIKSFRRFQREHFLCRVHDIRELGHYIEYIPAALVLDYGPVEGIRMEINLDLYEMLHRISEGYTPSLNELRGSYINLLIFKRQLASTDYDEVLLTEDEQAFYRVYKTPDRKLVVTDTIQG